MQILVDSNEWPRFKKYLGDEGLPIGLEFDFLIVTSSGLVAAERKRSPGDLLASAEDGRLARECSAMRREADFQFLISEGRISYSPNGKVRDKHHETHWTKTGVKNLLRSIRYVEGVDIEYTANTRETAQVLRELYYYFDNPRHGSYRARSTLKPDYYVTTWEEQYLHWLQGLPGISMTRAKRIVQVLTNPAAVLSASQKDWTGISGIGDKTMRSIWNFLHPEEA